MTVVMADPFGSGYVGDTKNPIATTGNAFSRMENTVKYVSPKVSGFLLELAVAAGEVAGDHASGRQLGGAVEYATGPFRLRFGYHDRNNNTSGLRDTDNARNAVVGAVYDVGFMKLYGIVGRNSGLNSSVWRNNGNPFGRANTPVASTDSRDALVGVTVPFAPHAVMASYIHKDNRTLRNQNASQIALGYRYSMSNRTELYAAYARIYNRRGRVTRLAVRSNPDLGIALQASVYAHVLSDE